MSSRGPDIFVQTCRPVTYRLVLVLKNPTSLDTCVEESAVSESTQVLNFGCNFVRPPSPAPFDVVLYIIGVRRSMRCSVAEGGTLPMAHHLQHCVLLFLGTLTQCAGSATFLDGPPSPTLYTFFLGYYLLKCWKRYIMYAVLYVLRYIAK